MKKAIILVLTTFLVFVIFLSSKNVNAELTPITPFYGGDIFNGNELYLFQNYSATPNFQNGYISKQTITNQDVYYQENSYYNGWYKNLGEDLIYEYTEPEHEPEQPIFYFYITLNGLFAQYFQFALICPEPFEAEYTIKFRNENPFVFLTANQYNDYLVTPPTNDMTKEIEWFCFEVYFPDYMASFRPLTAQLAYEFGFNAGEMSGYDRGWNTGYSTGYTNGHTDGYNEGSIDTQYGVNTVVNFNQLVKNPNFETRDYWHGTSGSFTVENNIGYYTSPYVSALYNIIGNIDNNHKVYYSATFKTNNTDLSVGLYKNSSYYYVLSTSIIDEYVTLETIVPIYSVSTDSFDFRFRFNTATQGQKIDIKYVKLIDLTQIYGIGNEPTNIETIKNDFPSNYYPYTTMDLINIDYQNGYIKGEKEGYATGYEKGKDVQATQQLTTTGWIGSIFGGISSLLNIQIFPGVTIGIIVGIPFVISLAYFVIRAFRGGGGD